MEKSPQEDEGFYLCKQAVHFATHTIFDGTELAIVFVAHKVISYQRVVHHCLYDDI
jgi:hypothetical protein